MKFRSLLLSAVLFVASAATGSATTYNLGDVTGGANSTKTLAVQKLDFISFTLNAPVGLIVSAFDIAVTSIPGSNLRTMIGLYSGNTLVASNDSGVGRGGGTATLHFDGATMLADGPYTLAIGGWKSFFTTDIANARSTAFFNNGRYSVSFTSTISAVPLPAGGFLLLTGLAALAMTRRKTRNPQA